jgi:hypothetical protein
MNPFDRLYYLVHVEWLILMICYIGALWVMAGTVLYNMIVNGNLIKRR